MKYFCPSNNIVTRDIRLPLSVFSMFHESCINRRDEKYNYIRFNKIASIIIINTKVRGIPEKRVEFRGYLHDRADFERDWITSSPTIPPTSCITITFSASRYTREDSIDGVSNLSLFEQIRFMQPIPFYILYLSFDFLFRSSSVSIAIDEDLLRKERIFPLI